MTKAQKDWPVVQMQRKFPGLPRPMYASEARMDTETERYVPESRLLSERAIDAAVAEMDRPNSDIFATTDEAVEVLQAAIKAASEQ